MTIRGAAPLRAAGLIAAFIGVIGLADFFAVAAEQDSKVQVMMKGLKGENVGVVHLEETPNGVLIHGDLAGLPEGMRAIHIHEVGKCEPPFESAGSHFHDGASKHGFANPQGFHAGDLPNLNVPASGKVSFEAFAPKVRFKGSSASLLDADGSAIVVHAGPDDYRSDPAGGAGERIACGVIRSVDNVTTKDLEDTVLPKQP